MIRHLTDWLRDHRGLLGIAALAVALSAIIALQGMRADDEPIFAHAAEPFASPAPLSDTDHQVWEIEIPEQGPEPDPQEGRQAPEPTPTSNVNWNELAMGAADVRVSHDPTPGFHADVAGRLSGDQAAALISAAELEEAQAGAGRLPSYVGAVIAAGTPRSGGGGGGICK